MQTFPALHALMYESTFSLIWIQVRSAAETFEEGFEDGSRNRKIRPSAPHDPEPHIAASSSNTGVIMPRNPPGNTEKLIHPGVAINAIRHALSPLSNYSRCESPAFVRRALTHAIQKDLTPASPYHVELVPSASTVSLGANNQRSKDTLKAIENDDHIKRAAIEAAAQLKKARLFFEQAESVGEEIKPILYYYGGTYFLDFICLNLVRREPGGSPGHGLHVTTDSEGWDFDREWARKKCRVHVDSTGDFPFYVDALTVSGRVTLFSRFRLHRDTKSDPWVVQENPFPLFLRKASLDLLCNFDQKQYLENYPEVKDWLVGTDAKVVWKLTSLMMDLMIVYVAASLARYSTPAWTQIIEANRDDIYNDIRAAYHSISEGFALFFEDEHPFQYSYYTRIPTY